MPFQPMPAVEELNAAFSYDPNSGLLRWRIRPANRVKIGDEAGSPNSRGYKQVKFGPKLWLVHRLIWKIVTGREPVGEVDHRDGSKINNRWGNLREASDEQNAQNAGRRRDNKSGFKGVNKRGNRWVARIQANGKRRNIGSFITATAAAAAYRKAAATHHGRFARVA